MAGQWPQYFTAASAVVEELAGIGGHFLFLKMAALGARQRGMAFNVLVHGGTLVELQAR